MTDDNKLNADIADHCENIESVLTKINESVAYLRQNFESMEHKGIILGQLMSINKNLENVEDELQFICKDQQKVFEWRYEDIEHFEKRMRDLKKSNQKNTLIIERVHHPNPFDD